MRVSETSFLAFAARTLNVPAAALSLATAYGALPQWDSVAQLQLAMAFEAEYGVRLTLAEIVDLRTLQSFYERLPH